MGCVPKNRKIDVKNAIHYYDTKFSNITLRNNESAGEQAIFEKITNLYNNIIVKEREKSNMEEKYTVGDIITKVESASTDFERTNTDLKRRYIIWNIESFNIVASKISGVKGTFGTGYPFYGLDRNLEGILPIIPEQIRYNRQLLRDGEPYQKSIWQCQSCLSEKKYDLMPDLKSICKPCPSVFDKLKPRKIINRLPDIDMWVVCEDGCQEQVQEQLCELLEQCNMNTSDKNPLRTFEEMSQIVELLKQGIMPETFLPIDLHIMEYSKINGLIKTVPSVLEHTKREGQKPYLPIQPISYRKEWQYEEAYNFVYDFLSAFTEFNFEENLQNALNQSRVKVATSFTKEELFRFLLDSATESNRRRFDLLELEELFFEKIEDWQQDRKSNKHGDREVEF